MARQWTIYLAQDKHLDYGWCGTQAEIEVRMATLVDYYLDQAQRTGSRWNLDGTIWLDVYRRQRGEAGASRLLDAIRQGTIGYAANQAVLLWGILSTELAIRACYGSLPIERATGTPNQTVLVMENPGMPWGVANVLTECGFRYLGRGIYALRAEGYARQREPYPLFWWIAPNGERLLVRWDLYEETRSWGGYAEAFKLAGLAGEQWDAFQVRHFGDRNTPEVLEQRAAFIRETVARYEAYGDTYPISSILLLGTGWDNWTCTGDYAAFVRRFNANADGQIHLVDARYEDYFHAALTEIQERGLELPTQEGSFGICWEEWPAHLANSMARFRVAERLMRMAESRHALASLNGQADESTARAIREGMDALLRFAEHDFGGCDRATAAISAGVRAAAGTEALAVGRALCADAFHHSWPVPRRAVREELAFTWHGGRVRFDGEQCAVESIVDQDGLEWVPQAPGLRLGQFVHSLYHADALGEVVFAEAATTTYAQMQSISCLRGANGVEVRGEGACRGFFLTARWFLHTANPWIDVRYDLEGGWSDEPQVVRFCFPLAVDHPMYRYDMGGAILVAGPPSSGGHDLPGANPALCAAQTFAAVHGADRGAILVTPDAYLVVWRAGRRWVRSASVRHRSAGQLGAHDELDAE